MSNEPAAISASPVAPNETKGMLLGVLGVIAFSLTLPATRAAVADLHPLFVGAGRVVVAAVLSGIVLFLGKHRRPTRGEFKALLFVAAGVGCGFPLFTALAMKYVNASHGGVVLGILPLATALAGAVISHERPSKAFWLCSILGSALVVVFSWLKASGGLQWADVALLAAVASAAMGYAVGARLSKSLGGLQVISWALLIAAPIMLIPAAMMMPRVENVSASAWLGFAYASFISQYLGFLPWYRGLALGGTARVGQTQLLQPFLTIAASAALLGEALDATTIAFAVLVFATVAVGRNLRIGSTAS
jgi:drug/metabolite transporter (DMT)-like permease